MIRSIIKISLIVIASLLAVVILAIIIIPPLYKDKIRVVLENEIDKKTDANVTFDSIDLMMFRHFPNVTLTINDLVIAGKEEFIADTLVKAKEIQFELNVWSLFRKETEIKSIHLVQPQIKVLVLKDGKANYDIMLADTSAVNSTASPSSVNVAIDQMSIEDGRIYYKDATLGAEVIATGIKHLGKADFLQDIFDYSTQTSIHELSINYDSVQYMLKKRIKVDMVMEMNIPESKFTFRKNEIHINHFKFGVEGFFQKVVDTYAMDLKFDARETKFKNILSLVPGLYMDDFDHLKTEGDIVFNGFLNGIYSDKDMPAFHLETKVKDAMVKIDSLPEAFNNIQFDFVIDNPEHVVDSTVFNLKTFHVELGKRPIHGSFKVQGLNSMKIDADIMADLELSELESLYPVKGIDIRGKIDFELKAHGKYDRLKPSSTKIPFFNLTLQMANGGLHYDSLPEEIKNVQFHLTAENNTGNIANTIIDFKKIHAELGKNPIHGFARFEGYPDTKIDADIDVDMDLEDVEKLYPMPDYKLKGILDVDITANGIYSKAKKLFPIVDAKINFTNGYALSKDYPEPIEDIHFIGEATSKNGTLADARLDIKKLTYTLEGEPFNVTGNVANLEKYNYNLTIDGKVDLEKITKVYPIQGMRLKGIIESHIQTTGNMAALEEGRYTETASSGTVEVKDFVMYSSMIQQPIAISDALFVFTPSKIVMQKMKGKFGKSVVSATGDISNYMSFMTNTKDLITADLDVVCDTLNINEWMPRANVGGPTDTSTFKMSVIEVPKNVNFKFDSDIRYIQYDDMKITEMQGEINLKEGVMTLHETGFNSLDAKFSISGDYNTRDMNHPLFDFDIDVKELDINRAYREIGLVRQLAPSAEHAFGKFSVVYTLKGEFKKDMTPKLETLVGGGEMKIAEAKIDGMKLFEEISKSAKKEAMNNPHLKDFSMKTEIRDSKIFVKPFSISVNGFETDIEGVNGMDGSVNYIVKIELLPIDKLKIPFHVTGQYDNPKIAIGKGHKLPE